MLGGLFGSDSEEMDEEDLEKLREKKKQLERKAEIQKLKRVVDANNRGLRDKLGRVLDDFSKRGSGNSALSILVGPAEGPSDTENFLLGRSDSGVEDMSLSEFITGQSNGHMKSKPFSFKEVTGVGEKNDDDADWYEKGVV